MRETADYIQTHQNLMKSSRIIDLKIIDNVIIVFLTGTMRINAFAHKILQLDSPHPVIVMALDKNIFSINVAIINKF